MIARILAGLALLALFPGCVAWRTDETGFGDSPPLMGSRPRADAGTLTLVHALWHGRYEDGRIVDRTPTEFVGDRHTMALRYAGTLLKASGYFRSIKPADFGGDLHLEIAYTTAPADPSWWFYVSRLLFHLVPASTDTRVEVSAVMQRYGQEVKRYRYAETMTELFWVPLVVALPFTSPASVQNDLNNALYTTLIRDLAADRVIPYRSR